ncbi:MAG TPA: DNA polymerase III subunit delta' [Candidatus Atribacteria bacterium]|nr:DNA polymerase III subunit delta' [Candidatus Atribacteria bacterium]HPT79195.1 DNA polymerase III subunit delta' [Candidatus Atribacteria bacterium]
MNTSGIVGQSQLLRMMDSILSGGRIAHAYIFAGPRGAGKKTLSSLFVKAMLCRTPGDKPCHACKTCRQYDSGNHPDVSRISRPEDKQIIPVDLIRAMRDDIIVKPFQNGKKIFFIYEADRMTEQAQNALLKTLEEPPDHACIILLTENMNALLPTILSRCQIFRISSLPVRDAAQIVMQRLGLPAQEARVYAALARGIPGLALELAGDGDFREQRNRLLAGLDSAGLSGLLELGPVFAQRRESVFNLLDMVELWFRDLLVMKETGDESLVVNADKVDLLRRQTMRFTSKGLMDIIQSIERCARSLNNYGNFELAIDNMLLGFKEGVH